MVLMLRSLLLLHTANLPNTVVSISHHLPPKTSPTTKTLLLSIGKMSSWTCSKCKFINPSFQKSTCQICLSPQPQSQSLHVPSSPSSSLPESCNNNKWSCSACTFLNPYRVTLCQICGTRASSSLLELDDDDLHQAHLGSSSIGSVFLPLRTTCAKKPFCESDSVGSDLTRDHLFVGNRREQNLDLLFSSSGSSSSRVSVSAAGKSSLSAVLRPCNNDNKRKDRDDDQRGVGAGFSAAAANKAVEVEPLSDETHLCSESKTWKIMSYNVWFREDLEMHNRMKALGNLIRLHLPDVICFQEVTPSFYEIFRQASWWKEYRCSISGEMEFPGAYFCMQLSKLPVKSYSSKPFHNTIMGRELCVADVEVQPDTSLVVATSHLESPCPGPPTWDQMFSKERVAQAKEAVKFLERNQNVIFCGDMNWDDKLDGPFPLSDGWVDAWTESRPGEVGWTYDTKSNKMISGNRALQKRLDRFLCKLKDFKISQIEMIGKDEIPGLSYVKEKRVKGQVKELVLPVLPSDHYGLLLTVRPRDSS